MSLAKRLDTLAQLRSYMLGNDLQWEAAKDKAYRHNGWFIPSFIELAIEHIAAFLEPARLQEWISNYAIPDDRPSSKTVGLVLPGNVPLAGFYDFLCLYITGCRQRIKLSPKDEVLLKHLVHHPLRSLDPEGAANISFEDMLKGCDAYVATDAGTLSQYLGKYPNILRKPGKMAAVVTGEETAEELALLADDVFQYFGQGYLNINKLYVPRDVDFIPLLKALDKYHFLIDHNKYKNNYDYQLALLILNKEFYMTNGGILLTEGVSTATPAARLNYEYYDDLKTVPDGNGSIAAGNGLAGNAYQTLGRAGQSVISEHLSGPDTLQFLLEI